MNGSGFGGTTISRIEVAGVILSETRYDGGSTLEHHAHREPYFCLVRRGGFRERSGRRRTEHRTGAVVFHPPDDEHSDEFLDSGADCFNVEVPRRLLRDLPSTLSVFRSGALRQILTRLHAELSLDARSGLIVEGLVYQALGEALERGGDGSCPDRIALARDEIRQNFATPVSLADLARNVGMHPVTLSRGFRRRFGQTIAEFVRGVRIEVARDLLRNPSLSLAEVALSAGFADQSHFSRVFRRETGSTPGAYRRNR